MKSILFFYMQINKTVCDFLKIPFEFYIKFFQFTLIILFNCVWNISKILTIAKIVKNYFYKPDANFRPFSFLLAFSINLKNNNFYYQYNWFDLCIKFVCPSWIKRNYIISIHHHIYFIVDYYWYSTNLMTYILFLYVIDIFCIFFHLTTAFFDSFNNSSIQLYIYSNNKYGFLFE